MPEACDLKLPVFENEWFSRTKDWYDKKERGLIDGQPTSFHYWAVDGEKFIGEFQLRILLKLITMQTAMRFPAPVSDYMRSIRRIQRARGTIEGMADR